MDIDPAEIQVDRTFWELWRLWVKLFDSIPYWDPYGAAAGLFAVGLFAGLVLYRVIHDT